MNLVRQQRAQQNQQPNQQHVNNINTSTKVSDQETPVQPNDNVVNNVNNGGNDVANNDVDRDDVAKNDVDHGDETDHHISDNHDEASWEKATRDFFQSTEDPPSSEN